jgi:hypothetical protein
MKRIVTPVILALILIIALSCNLPFGGGGGESATPTEDAPATQTASAAQLEATLNAYVTAADATGTSQAETTLIAGQTSEAGVDAEATAQAAQSTIAAQNLQATVQAQSADATLAAVAIQATLAAQSALETAQAAASNPPPPPPPSYPRISFASGGTSATKEGNLPAGGIADYVIRALSGQTMLVNVYSPGDNVYLGVIGLSDGIPLLRTIAEESNFRTTLPATQDYRLTVAAPFAPSNYTLQVIIPARIQFQSGAISASVDGHLGGNQTNYYLARASAGQTMEVKIVSPGNSVLLTIYGLDDGIPLVRYVSGAWQWSGVLPATQDYMIEAFATDGATNYTVQVKIQ